MDTDASPATGTSQGQRETRGADLVTPRRGADHGAHDVGSPLSPEDASGLGEGRSRGDDVVDEDDTGTLDDPSAPGPDRERAVEVGATLVPGEARLVTDPAHVPQDAEQLEGRPTRWASDLPDRPAGEVGDRIAAPPAPGRS